ncbi:Cobyrinate a,c-diamide synthase [Ferriphaselus amnicola]|uniref:Cobyrinate a,c-diamide synthase n=1 Tax=Ferriphaselus amnicola TaxID=1188319 RepID=A0A2Z6GBT6_9PROT|nr:cobyrinate a,c-diamide synthase [Ferriphaselus amnicola]BBE50850.1 Cobyrinate a,c-diamide synthase [Ferriphaselus amnicola]
MRFCPALFISAPASGQGKTTVTAAIAAYHRGQGRRVRVFKTGPDFIDPTILATASGQAVYQLDLWMGSVDECCARLYDAAGEADLILIEGVMGLFDGKPSSADLARQFGVPILAVIDASAMAQTFAALAVGLARLDSELPFFGVLANRVASTRHAEMLTEHLPDDLNFCGALPRTAEITLPERHLGLLQAAELPDITARITHAATLWAQYGVTELPPAVGFLPAPLVALQGGLAGVRIAVARDAAFSFLYQANLDVLRELGAELRFFSPLEDANLPDCDSVYLPGGYPELHLKKLSSNATMLTALRNHHSAEKPILAECGGMLYALQSLADKQGASANLLGLLNSTATMQPRLTALALQSAVLPQGTLRGHTFHYSKLESDLLPVARGACPNGYATSEAVYQQGRLTASYIHFYFPSNPLAVAQLFLP